jgi:hypothetical protein
MSEYRNLGSDKQARAYACAEAIRVGDYLPVFPYFGHNAPKFYAEVLEPIKERFTMVSCYWSVMQKHPRIYLFVMGE